MLQVSMPQLLYTLRNLNGTTQ